VSLSHSTSVRSTIVATLCVTMLAIAAVVVTPRRASAMTFDRTCDCTSTYCQDTGGTKYMRWCCDGSNCGCTLFVVGCGGAGE
jgi:hypothetical protein